MIDTGGQPEILENLPSLIHHCHLIVLVLNLMFGLDEHPSIDYHEEGEAYKRPLPSQLSNKQIMQKLASTLQAKRFYQQKAFQKEQIYAKHSSSPCFRLLVVATHRDCVPEGELETRVEAFDQALRDVLLPANNEELIFFSANQIPFVLNLKDPDKEDQTMLDIIRSEISEGKVGEVVKTPGSFLVFEQVLAEFASKTAKRDIVSLKECQVIGEKLNMKPEEVEAALIFFHHQFTLLYFRHILPKLVFTKPKMPLECINAVVRFSYKVESGDVMGIPGNFVSSLRDGIITEEIISHKQLTQCFIPGLYEPCDAIDLLCHTLTLAPLSHEVQSTPDSSHPATSTPPPSIKREKREYLMMCLQKPIPNKDLPQHLPPPSEIAPLVVQFTKNCVPLSCFSRTISCLLAIYDWKLSRDDKGSPQCLAHNVVSLYTPQTPGQVVLADMGHSLQVHIKTNGGIKPKSFPGICFHVKETILAAIKHVFELLNLAGIEVSSAFVCPCLGVAHSHTASAYLFQSQWLLRCSVTGNSAGEAENKHKVWFEAPVVEQRKPSLPKVLELDIPLKVGAKYFQFGVLLLNDEDGTLVEALEDEYNGKQERIVCKILAEWVRGRGRALSWKTLSDTLRDCSLSSFAEEVKELTVQNEDEQQSPAERIEFNMGVIAEKTMVVTNEELDIDWKGYGLRIHIPSNSLPEDCSQLQLKMTVSRPKDYKLPAEDGILVSAVYSLSHNLGERKLRQQATLEIQHCVKNHTCPQLCMAQSNEIFPPSQFHILEGVRFDSREGYGSIQLDHFCGFWVYLKWYASCTFSQLNFCAALCYINVDKYAFEFLLYILPQLDAIIDVS